MTISMFQASAPLFLRQLDVLSTLLDKASAFATEKGVDPETLTQARLADDMHPLTRQIQFATDSAKGAMARLSGTENPSFPDTETTIDELKARVGKTRDYVAGFTADQIDGSEDRAVVIKTPSGDITLAGQPYLVHFAIPNFLFHATTTYAILRQQGVLLGKRDYLGG